MKGSDLAILGAIGVVGLLLYRQQRGGSASITWRLPSQFAVSDGALLPSFDPGVSSAGPIVPGGNAPWRQRLIAPELWTLGGSPSGYNPAGAIGYDGVPYMPLV